MHRKSKRARDRDAEADEIIKRLSTSPKSADERLSDEIMKRLAEEIANEIDQAVLGEIKQLRWRARHTTRNML